MSQNELNPIVIISSASLRPLIVLVPTHLPPFNMKFQQRGELNELAGEDILEDVVEQMIAMIEPDSADANDDCVVCRRMRRRKQLSRRYRVRR